MIVIPIKTRIFKQGEDLEKFIVQYVPKLKEGSVLVITSKIVALAQGRVVKGSSKVLKSKVIRAESELVLKTKHYWLTRSRGELLSAAGVDLSNANGNIILLPVEPFTAASILHNKLRRLYKVKNCGVLVTDSRTARFRSGSQGTSVGYAGFKGLREYTGKKDIFGGKFVHSQVNVADSLAAAAVVCMGEGKEKQPLAVIEGAPVEWVSKVNPKELYIDPKDDVYRPYFDWLNKQKKRKK